MIVILSNTPAVIIRHLVRQHSLKRWVYFGKKQSILDRLNVALAPYASSIDYARRLYSLSQENRSRFIDWIDEISLSGAVHKEWLFSVPAVKNTYTSNLFLYVCYFCVLKEWLKENEKIDLVIVDSPALGFTMKRYFSPGATFPKMNYLFVIIFYLEVFLRAIFRWARFGAGAAKKYFAAKRVFKSRIKTLFKDKESVVLIRNFIAEDFSKINCGIFERHFFPGLDNYLKKHDVIPVFLPITLKIKSFQGLFRRILESEKLVIFPEEFLKPSDYLYALFTWWRALWHQITPVLFDGYDLSVLVKEEYHSNLTEDGLMSASLLSRLAKRFEENDFVPQGMINWNENQAMEKGLISGFKEIFPMIKIVGSQPFVTPPNYLSSILSRQDRLLGLVPDKTLVLGPVGREAGKEFINDIPIDYSPAFRYVNLLAMNHRSYLTNNLIVLLGFGLSNSVHIVRALLKANGKLGKGHQVFIKLHPAGYFDEKRLIKELGQTLPEHYSFVQGPLENYLDQVSIGVCGATGAAVDLVVSGIPTIMIADTHSLTMNYLSYKEDPSMWRLCFSEEEVVEALDQFRTMVSTEPQKFWGRAEEFRRAYFAEPNSRYWENYLITTSLEISRCSEKLL